MAWPQRTILFSQNFTLGERIAAGAVLEQLSDGWKNRELCYNAQAQMVYKRLCNLEGNINRNEYFIDETRPVCRMLKNGELKREKNGDMREGT